MCEPVTTGFQDYGNESLIMPLIHRHETLSVTKQELEQQGGRLVQELEQGQRHLDLQKQQHSTDQLVGTNSKRIVLVKFMIHGYILNVRY